MKCGDCSEKLESCDGCGKGFEIDDDVWHDTLTTYHYCNPNCHPDLEESEVIE